MNFTPKDYAGSFNPFWRGECAVLPGGYAPTNEIPEHAIVRMGTPVEISNEDLTCKIAKSALVLDGGSDTEKRVAKGLLFVVGDEVTDGTSTTSGEGDEATTTANTAKITAIDKSNKEYDVLTLDSALTGTCIYVDCTPNAVIAADYENSGLGTVTLAIGHQCLLMYKALVAPLADAWKNGIYLVGNPNILLIVQ